MLNSANDAQQMIGTATTMKGSRFPHLERDRSDREPMSGSAIASTMSDRNMIVPAIVGEMPATLVR